MNKCKSFDLKEKDLNVNCKFKKYLINMRGFWCNFFFRKKMIGDAGHRSPYLSHAKRALYHLSYIPMLDSNYKT